MNPLRIAIHGAAGRMGRRLVALAAADPALSLCAAVDGPEHPRLGEDAGVLAGVGPLGVILCGSLEAALTPAPSPMTGRGEALDVVIDFSVPAAVEKILGQCLAKRIPIVIATTGLGPQQTGLIEQAAREIPVLWAPSMSLAVNLTMRLAEVAGRALRDKDADVEILERHHRYKEDAPSGTALKFGQIVAHAMGQTAERHGREGRPGARPHNEIGYHAIRVGDNPGEHTVIFAMLGETIELTVRASSRDCYALGALAAAKFLAAKPPRLYNMNDVLGLP
jgi:4-hydroxy-tetrahydrodipicolinate reductase